MKKNPISAIAGWKSAALLALVAMVAAVAFSGVLSSNQPADAQDRPTLKATHAYTSGTADVVVTTVSIDTAPADELGTAADGATHWNLRIITATGAALDSTSDPTSLAATDNGQCVASTSGSSTVSPVTGLAAAGVTLSGGTRYTITAHSGDSTASPAVCSKTNQVASLSITTPNTTLTGTTADVNAGKHFDVNLDLGDVSRFSLSDDGAEGSFAANGKTSLTCDDGSPCDLNAATGLMTIRVNVGAASKTGQHLYFGRVTGTTTASDIVLTVADPAPQAASFTVAPEKGEETAAAGTGTSTIVVTVMDDSSPVAKAFANDTTLNVTFITPNGKVTCGNQVPANTCSTTGTDSEGKATATLSDGVAGSSTITVLVGTLGTGSTEVTFFGPAANLAADAGQSSINLGGGAFVTFTVTDADDRPVKGADITQPIVDKVVPPDVEDAVKVAVALIDDGDAETKADNLPTGSPPYCGSDGGTDAKGQCVVRVSSDAAPPTAASRGAHTLNFNLVVNPTTTLEASVDITVAGPPDSISHDAPARIDTLDEIEVTVTVTDDAGNRVGTQAVSVTKVEGGGAILAQDDETANGEAKFTFLASSIEGNVVFVVRSGEDARAVINVAVGPEPVVEEEPEPEAPPATWNNELVSGQNLVVWNGEDGADPSAGSAMGVSGIWSYNTGSGTWDGYFPNAADVPGGNTLTSLSNGDAYFVIVE